MLLVKVNSTMPPMFLAHHLSLFSSVMIASLIISMNAHAMCSFTVKGTRSYYRSAISQPTNCGGEAKANVQNNLETILNVDYVAGSYAKGEIDSLAGRYGSGMYGGSYSKTRTSSGAGAIRYGNTRWIVTVDYCRPLNVSFAEGTDRGWGQGRANNGHCSADVSCVWRFTTYDLNCPR